MVGPHENERREAYFSGRVQGVGFRYTVRQIAADFDVVGFVRNLPDGRVELKIEGPADQIDGMIDAIHHHFGGYIVDVQQDTGPPKGEFNAFEVR